jgi:hypothetical protein
MGEHRGSAQLPEWGVMHEARGLVARLIQFAPENGVGVQGNSLSQVSRPKRPYIREDGRVRRTIKLDERAPRPPQSFSMMRPRPVILPLEREELMDRVERGAIPGRETDRGTARQTLHRIADPRSPGRHHGGAGDFLCVHEARDGEIPCAEGRGDLTHVVQDPHSVGAVGRVALELDPTPVRKGLEEVGGSVLIDPHRGVTAALQVGEAAVSLGRGPPGLGAGCRIGPG